MLVCATVDPKLFNYFRRVSEIPVDKRSVYKNDDIEFKFKNIGRIDYTVYFDIINIKSLAFSFKYLLCCYSFNGMFINIRNIETLKTDTETQNYIDYISDDIEQVISYSDFISKTVYKIDFKSEYDMKYIQTLNE